MNVQGEAVLDGEDIWWGLLACGCVCAWSLEDPREFSETTRSACSHQPIVVWVRIPAGVDLDPATATHRIIVGETIPMIPGVPIEKAWTKVTDRLDLTPEGCFLKNGRHLGATIESWFPPLGWRDDDWPGFQG